MKTIKCEVLITKTNTYVMYQDEIIASSRHKDKLLSRDDVNYLSDKKTINVWFEDGEPTYCPSILGYELNIQKN